jgi:hypothetical protein
MEVSVEGSLKEPPLGHYSRRDVHARTREPYDPLLAYFRRGQIPFLSARQREEALSCVPTEEVTDIGDIVVALIGRMHAKGIVLRRFEEARPHNIKKQEPHATYFGLFDGKPRVWSPADFVRVTDAYLVKYFGATPADRQERALLVSYELLSDLASPLGAFIDPTPSAHYQTDERARRAELYITAFREACSDKAFAARYPDILHRSAFSHFNPIYDYRSGHERLKGFISL